MADISNEIDRIAQVIAEKSNKAVEEVVNSLIELTQGKTAEEALEVLGGINLQYAMEAKMAGAFAEYEAGVVMMLENMYSTSALSEAVLQSLLNNTKAILSSELTNKLSSNMMQSIVNGISSGQTPVQVMDAIGAVTPNIETLVVTTYGQYSNAVTNLISQKLPDNTKYVYIGAYDSRTREACVSKIESSPATRSEIIAQFGDMNNEIWNCRHGWEQMSSSPKDQGFNKEKFTDAG
tara:strand:- start:19 stop:726 length:708 start_codon:yes stop_codon:yes gene_type:complete